MKNLKKLTSLLLALVMVFAMSATAFAAEANLTNHTYKAYQIFAGTQAEGSAELAGIEWGSGVDGETLLTALNAKDAFKDCTSAADVAEVLADYADDSEDARAFAKLAYANKKGTGAATGETLAAGYYLVVDETTFDEDDKNTVYNLALLQLTNDGEFEIKNKTEIPTVEKKVDDVNDSLEDPDTVVWQDSADYDIGDDVPFQLTGTLPSDFATYTTYKYVFHDTMAEGLTYNEDLKVYLVNGETETEITSHFTTDAPANEWGGNLVATCTNLKKVEGVTASSKIVVRYTAELNEKAKLGYIGNENEVYLEYSNNPNASGQGEPTGKTPIDTVIVFTYKLDVDKVDESGNALAGAGFTLYKFNKAENEWGVVKEIAATEAGTNFEFRGLDDGQYKLVETTVPAGYNKAADIEFTVEAGHATLADDPALESITVNNEAITVEMAENDEYYTGNLLTDVENKAGATLPETGGIGTKMFYVIGAILVVGAAVVMITKKRMSR